MPTVVAAALLAILASPAAQDPSQAPDVRLSTILLRAEGYCDRLSKAALDLVCLEEVREKLDLGRDARATDIINPVMDAKGRLDFHQSGPGTRRENVYLYDLQFVRNGELHRESRTLLKRNGRKVAEKEAPLETSAIRVENALFGPVGLFGRDWRRFREYALVTDPGAAEAGAVAIRALPTARADAHDPGGTAWVREADGAVLRVAWAQETLGHYEVILERAAAFGAEPQIVSITEYGLEKKGLRFPTRDVTEESYIDGVRRFVRASTTIEFRDYRFFTVEVESR